MTYIEILDSAVKIGLGAAISGLATYFVTKLKSEKDNLNEIAKHKREVVQRISLGVQQSASQITQAMAIIQRLPVTSKNARPQAISKALEIYLKAFEAHNTVEGLAALLGHADLNRELTTYADAAEELFYLIRGNPSEMGAQDKVIHRINQSRTKIVAAIHDVYERTAS